VNAPIRVKICGITNRDCALASIDAGADALGFNLFSGSKRHIALESLIPWLPSLGGRVLKVAVMVNPSIEELLRARPLFDAIQLHGQETPAFCAQAAAAGILWKAFPLAQSLTAAAVAAFPAHALLIDSSIPGAFGGAGALIDLDRAAGFVRAVAASMGRPVWLSGGLKPENVAEAVERVRPYGVDAASGVEVPGEPRRKDIARVRAFIAAARGAAGAV
jgi:phosphoribosylanthranilate isomerase